MKHATGQKLPVTTIVREYPQEYGPGHEPYVPRTDYCDVHESPFFGCASANDGF